MKSKYVKKWKSIVLFVLIMKIKNPKISYTFKNPFTLYTVCIKCGNEYKKYPKKIKLKY